MSLMSIIQHSLRVMSLFLIRRQNRENLYNNTCIRGYLFNNHQYHSKEVFHKCTNGTKGEPFLRTDVTPTRIEFEMTKIVDRIVIDGFKWNTAFAKGLKSLSLKREFLFYLFKILHLKLTCDSLIKRFGH